jgi:hypothetical protein
VKENKGQQMERKEQGGNYILIQQRRRAKREEKSYIRRRRAKAQAAPQPCLLNRKEKETKDLLMGGGMKRSKSGDSRSDVESGDIAADAEKRKADTTTLHSIQEAKLDSLAGCESETHCNRIPCCLVVSPAGRPLHTYRSVRELLEALRDVIAGDKLLLEKGKILHWNISESNIIITEAAAKGESKGMLIDLNLAKELDSLPSGASHQTGTMQFMAIEVLQGKGHTYRHDLESFFYVFTWMCIRYGCGCEDTGDGVETAARGERRKRARLTTTSVLRDWYTGNCRQIANTKLGHMDKNGFENVVAEFAPQFESLKQLALSREHRCCGDVYIVK